MNIEYDTYNREERSLCFHLFRLLHERLAFDYGDSALASILTAPSMKGLQFENAKQPVDLSRLTLENVAIFAEVALIRDKYVSLKPHPEDFLDGLVRLIQQQEGVSRCRPYSLLPDILRNPHETHPRQIRYKADKAKIPLTNEERTVYGKLQAMFNAKPDFAIRTDDLLLTFEAKLTERFDAHQLDRTWKITEAWASLLYADLGFKAPPAYTVVKLGLAKSKPDLSWQDVLLISRRFYDRSDRSLMAFDNALNFDPKNKVEPGPS